MSIIVLKSTTGTQKYFAMVAAAHGKDEPRFRLDCD